MRDVLDVFIIGAGQTPVAEHWDRGLRELGAAAIRQAMDDAGIETVDALFVGNMLGGAVNGQENLGALLADAADLLPAEAWKVEAACASGGAAVRAAALSVAAGVHEVAVAIGIEKMTDAVGDQVAAGLATASDGDYEASHGLSFVALSALMMRRYMHETGFSREDFAPFAINAHKNAAANANAMFREPISAEQFARSPLVAAPIGVLDAAPVCDGAAAVVVCSREFLRSHHKAVRIAAAGAATDTIGLAGRADLLTLGVAKVSAEKCYAASGFGPKDVDFAPRGEALKRAAHGCYSPGGCVPVSTFGGLKARGHPVGASGAYQIVEATAQLRGEAGPNQVPGARVALTQSIGGHGSIAVAHILEA